MSGEEDSTVTMNWEGRWVSCFLSYCRTHPPARMYAHAASYNEVFYCARAYIRVGVTVTLCTHALNVLNEIMKRVYVSNREP